MFKSSRAPALFTLLTGFLAASSVQAISKITRSGRYLYDDSNNRFYIKGVAYQEQGEVVDSPDNPFGEPSTFIDPLALGDACQRDLPFLQQLGVNAIRVYSVNSSLNHDSCMNLFSQAGIYAIIDLATPLNGSIARDSPAWTTNLLDEYTRTIDTFSKYDNVLAYNVGNEVIVTNNTGLAPPYVKAAARDIKAYLTSKGSSALVGYAAINGPSDFRAGVSDYLSCDPSGGNSGSTAIDLFGLNDYEWCGDSTFQASYAATTSAFANYNVVAYFSEYGCVSTTRLWTEAVALFSSDMNTVWSGGIAFSYFPASSAAGQFGMVNISSDQQTVTVSDDFNRLKTEYGTVSFINSPSQSSAGAATYPSCAAPVSAFLASNTLPQTPNESACDCLESALSCRFTPTTSDFTATVGELLDTGCSLLGSRGGSCDSIGGNATTGVYGQLSACDPTVKLSFVMSSYYELTGRSQDSCSFGGNGTVNTAAPAASASAAASSCIANPSAVFTPSSAPTGGSNPVNTNNPSSPSGTKGAGSSAVALIDNSNALFGMTLMAVVSVFGAVFTLA